MKAMKVVRPMKAMKVRKTKAANVKPKAAPKGRAKAKPRAAPKAKRAAAKKIIARPARAKASVPATPSNETEADESPSFSPRASESESDSEASPMQVDQTKGCAVTADDLQKMPSKLGGEMYEEEDKSGGMLETDRRDNSNTKGLLDFHTTYVISEILKPGT